jgi:choline transport protein
MNYNSVIIVGVIALSALWWVLHATRHYPGPKVMGLYIHDDSAPLNQPGALQNAVAKEEEKKAL